MVGGRWWGMWRSLKSDSMRFFLSGEGVGGGMEKWEDLSGWDPTDPRIPPEVGEHREWGEEGGIQGWIPLIPLMGLLLQRWGSMGGGWQQGSGAVWPWPGLCSGVRLSSSSTRHWMMETRGR